MSRQILHVDMDAFYAAVEQRDQPELRGKPLIVGGTAKRGVVMTASYEARPFGVRSAMSMGEALRLCPQAVVVMPRMARYAEASAQVFAIFGRFTPLVEGLSLDEAFLDVTDGRALFGDGEATARRIQAAIRAETALTASAGVAPCKFAAKVASDLRKPEGLVVVPEDGVAEFLAPLPVESMWGIGPKASVLVRGVGLHTIGDLATADEARLVSLLGSWGAEIRALARGIDGRAVVPGRPAESVGAEETFETDLTEPGLARHLLEQSRRVARRLHEAGLAGRAVVVKVKYADFTIQTRRKTLRDPIADTDSIYEAAKDLLTRFALARKRVRLTGVSVTHLCPGPPSPTLFPDARAVRRQKVEELTARVRHRFGSAALTRATLLEEDD